jgi:hypothetical protein
MRSRTRKAADHFPTVERLVRHWLILIVFCSVSSDGTGLAACLGPNSTHCHLPLLDKDRGNALSAA